MVLSRVDQSRVKRWYVQEDCGASEIASKLGMPENAKKITQWLGRKGIIKFKREQRGMVTTRNVDIAHVNSEMENESEMIQAFKDQAQELTEKGFQYGRKAANVKDFKDAAQATKTFLEVYARANSLATPTIEAEEAGGVNIFLIGMIEAEAPPTAQEANPVQVHELEPANNGIGL